jgi:hypothetical protein
MRAFVLLSALLLTAASASAGGQQTEDGITLSVRPLINPQLVWGSLASGRGGQQVTVQFKQCGLLPVEFRDVSEVTTLDGGTWSDDLGASTNGTFRAISGGAVSNSVPVQERADVRLTPRPPGRYEVDVVATLSYWRKRVLLQRFDRSRRTWVTVRPLVLAHQHGPGLIWSTTDTFKPKVAKGTTIRAVLPLDQAKPCLIAGYSRVSLTS